MHPRVAFGIQSAVHKSETLQQLVDALDGRAVVIHHDFSQQPDFRIVGPDVHFVPSPAKTGWADWGLVAGIHKTIGYALEHLSFDYLQLLSPVDLPIRPLPDFEAFLAASPAQFHCDAISLADDEMAFMSFAYRVYAIERSMPYRLLWRLWLTYFGSDPETELRGGLAIPLSGRCDSEGKLTLAARAASKATHRIVHHLCQRDPKLARFPAHVGSMWFGASRQGCEHLWERLRDPALLERFRDYFCAGEMLFNTTVALSGMPYDRSNHALSAFVGARPQWLGPEDLDRLETSGKHFARKFPDDPHSPVRRAVLERIGARTALTRAPAAPSDVPPAPPAAEPGDAIPAGAGSVLMETAMEAVSAPELSPPISAAVVGSDDTRLRSSRSLTAR